MGGGGEWGEGGGGGGGKSEWLVRAIRPSEDRGGRGPPPEQHFAAAKQLEYNSAIAVLTAVRSSHEDNVIRRAQTE